MITIATKRCPQCGILKSTDEFYTNNNSNDRLTSQCKECLRLYQNKTNRTIRKREDIEYLPKEKNCPTCGKVKRQFEFYLHKTNLDGLRGQCIDCEKEYRTTNGKYIKLETKFGLTKYQYQKILESQGGVCAMCGCTSKEEGRALVVDHDHKTDKIRGILCNKCNLAVGLLRDSSKLMRDGADYLDNGVLRINELLEQNNIT